MTFLNVVSIVVFLAVVTAAIALRRFLKRRIDEADGMGDVHERKEGKGDAIASVGRKDV